jgi:hypothetical protein
MNKLEKILRQKVEDFRSKWNTKTHDWIFCESTLFFKNMIIASFCREYAVGTDENAYSMIYVFSEQAEPSRIYYSKFWDGYPEWRDASLFLRTIKSAEEKSDGSIVIQIDTEDGMAKTLTFKP